MKLIVEGSPYDSRVLHTLEIVLFACIYPLRMCFDRLISCFLPSLAEQRSTSHLFLQFTVIPVLCAVGAILATPVAIIAFLLWAAFQNQRRPYRYSRVAGSASSPPPPPTSTYCVATANICLLPECGSRYNNLPYSLQRAAVIGNRIGQSQLTHVNYNSCGDGFNRSVLDHFPQTDVLLMQEAFDMRYTMVMLRELHVAFPHIVYDVGVHSFASNLYNQNSGLMVASKHPIECVEFNCFMDSYSQCRFASKGLLQVKILLGKLASGQKLVGYIFNTHLQTYQGHRSIQSKQLDDILKWTTEFRRETVKSDEIVVFDVLGGDFNFDNMSPGDAETCSHKLFSVYTDVCQKRPGEDHTWAIGTEMRQLMLYEPQISTPAGLQQALSDPVQLHHYVLDADVAMATRDLMTALPKVDRHGNPLLGNISGRRRVDYLLYRSGSTELAQKVVAFNPISQLAQLTDHIPLAITLEVAKKLE